MKCYFDYNYHTIILLLLLLLKQLVTFIFMFCKSSKVCCTLVLVFRILKEHRSVKYIMNKSVNKRLNMNQ